MSRNAFLQGGDNQKQQKLILTLTHSTFFRKKPSNNTNMGVVTDMD